MKKSILLLATLSILCLTGMNSNAQTPNWLWAKAAGGIGYDYAQSVAVDSAGNSYMTGYFNMGINFGLDSWLSAGSADIYVVKFDPAGNFLWSKAFGGTDADIANSIALDASGNIYIAGYFKSPLLLFDTCTLTNAGGNTYDLFVVKCDAAGNVLWAKKSGGTGDDRAYSIAADASGNSYVSGYFASASLTFGLPTLTNSGNTDLYIVKYDPDGTALWARSATGSGFDYAYSVAADNAGNSYLTGNFNGATLTFGANVLTKAANIDIFVVKYSSAGTVLWTNRAGVSSDNVASSVAVDAQGNCYAAGYFKGTSLVFDTATLINAGNADMYLVKYDLAGDVQWATSAGGSLEEVAKSLAIDKSGYCYVTGHFKSTAITFGEDILTNAGTASGDIFIAEYNPAGSLVWAKSAGGTGEDSPNSIATDTLGNFFVAGYFYSTSITFDTTTISNGGTTDLFIAKSDIPPVSGINAVRDELIFSAFPNPAEDQITISLLQKATIEILSIEGQMIKTIQCNDNQTIIDLSTFSRGIYIIKIITDKGVSAKKFIKQ